MVAHAFWVAVCRQDHGLVRDRMENARPCARQLKVGGLVLQIDVCFCLNDPLPPV
jgi:hypothetical protein